MEQAVLDVVELVANRGKPGFPDSVPPVVLYRDFGDYLCRIEGQPLAPNREEVVVRNVLLPVSCYKFGYPVDEAVDVARVQIAHVPGLHEMEVPEDLIGVGPGLQVENLVLECYPVADDIIIGAVLDIFDADAFVANRGVLRVFHRGSF